MNDASNTKEEPIGEIAALKKRIADLDVQEQQYLHAQDELHTLREELEVQAWGLTKTNSAIKTLYKELEKKNIELQKLDTLKTDFIRTVSHELRTPLTTIREGISQILDGIHGEINEAQKEFLALSLTDVDRLKRMIDDLLDLAKLEAGKTKIHKRDLDLAALARGVIASFAPKAKSLNLELRESIPSQPLLAYVDQDSVIRVLTNLIGNALKFTDKGYVEIALFDGPQSIECRVVDTGRGIAEEDMPKVFSKFQQFDRSQGSGEKGTGLGLSICKHVLELHHGKIWVESKLHEGTSFIFTFPKYGEKERSKECLAQALQDALEHGACASVVMLGIRCVEGTTGQMERARVISLVADLEQIFKEHIRQSDIVFCNAQTVLIMFLGISKVQMRQVAERILASVSIAEFKAKEGVEIASEIIGVLEDGATPESIMERMEKAALG